MKYLNLIGKYNGKRPFTRVRRRWEVNTDLIELSGGVMNLNDLGQGKMKRRRDEKLADSVTEVNVFRIDSVNTRWLIQSLGERIPRDSAVVANKRKAHRMR